MGYAVINAGVLPIMLGEDYKLQQRVSDRWELLALPYGFRAIGYRLEPGGRRELSVRIPESLQPGRYRVCKRLIADRVRDPGREQRVVNDVEPIELTASFDVAL